MANKYLLHFAHDHISFRWTEFLALASKHNCGFRLLSEKSHLITRPYIFIELDDVKDEKKLISATNDSYCLKDLYEVWAQSDVSLDDLAIQVEKTSPQFKSKQYSGPEHSFRVNCESFGSKLTQQFKVEMIKQMKFMNTFSARANLTNPRQIYCIFEMNERIGKDMHIAKKEFYFGRHLAASDRHSIDKFSLKTRAFIANTSMDPMLSLVSANAARIKQNDLVFDPFAGSGSFLVAAAHKGAYVFGGDIDWKLMHGQSRSTRKGQKVRDEGECNRKNMVQYNLLNRYIDVMVSDISRSPLAKGLKFDAIISDPPYGVRECSEKIGIKRKEYKPPEKGKVRYPAKVEYEMSELLSDLLSLAAEHLIVNGRLVYFLPIVAETGDDYKSFIPKHSCLELIAYCEQVLIGKVYRLMVVMEKIREPTQEDDARVPELINGSKLRETYFTDNNAKMKHYDNPC